MIGQGPAAHRLLTDLVTNALAPSGTRRHRRLGDTPSDVGKPDGAASLATARYGPQFATDQNLVGFESPLASPDMLECPSLSCVILRCKRRRPKRTTRTPLAGAMLAEGVAQMQPGVNFRCG